MIERMTAPAFATPTAVSAGPLGVAQAADREIARLTAVRARALAEFAASRPASVDRQQGERGAMSPQRWAARPEVLRPVSEWATQELQSRWRTPREQRRASWSARCVWCRNCRARWRRWR